MKVVEIQLHHMRRLIYCSIGANSVNFTEVSVAILFHSSGPKQLNWTLAVTLIKELDLWRNFSYHNLNILQVTGASKPTEGKAKQCPASNLSVMLNFWLSGSCSWGKVSFTINRVFPAHDQFLTNKWMLNRFLSGKFRLEKAGLQPFSLLRISCMKRKVAGTWSAGNCECLSPLVSLVNVHSSQPVK